jgi:hypothetical protein
MGYKLSDLLRVIRNPRLIQGEVRKFGQKINRSIHKQFYTESGIDIFEQDWDNLIILDGCRFDTFEKINDIPGKLESRRSRGSSSWEFFQANFVGRQLHDTVYITANPHLYRLESGIFHSVFDMINRWDEELQTVPPSEIVNITEDVIREYPNKKYIFHFMQPHYPFIGSTGQKINHRGYKQDLESEDVDQPSLWDVLQWGKDPTITDETVREAYEENLKIAIDNVKEIIQTVEGRTVITADHGNLIGDRLRPIPVRGYGHPSGLRDSALVKVPWHIIESESRRKVTTEPPIGIQTRNKDDVTEHLAALGYVDT